MEHTKLWTKNFLAGTLVNFLLVLNYYLLMVIMTDYSVSHYHVSSSIAGLSASMFVIGALLARFFSAKLMEKIGKKNLLLAGVLLEIAASATYFFAVNIFILFFIRFIHGLSYGMASTSVSTVVTSQIPKERHGEGIGYFMLRITLGAAIGPFLGMSLINHGGFPYIFMTCILAAVLCFLGSLLLRSPQPATMEKVHISKQAIPRQNRGLANIFEKKAVPISLVCAGIYFCYSSIISFLTPYTRSIQLTAAATFFFIVYSAVILITRPFTGRLFDTKGEYSIMIPAFLSFFAGMILLSQTHNGFSLLLSAAFLGFGIGVIQSCGLALAVQKSSPERISYVNSTFYIFLDVGTGSGPFLLGFLIPSAGYRGMYTAMAGVTFLLCLLYLFISRKSAQQGENDSRREETENKDNYVITIGRQLGSGGSILGQSVAKQFGFLYLDRDVLKKAAEELGISEDEVEMMDEDHFSVINSMFQISDVYTMPYMSDAWSMPTSARLFEIESQIIRQAVKRQPCVVIGRCGSHLFCEYKKHISIFLYADEEYRLEILENELSFPHEKSKKMIEKEDLNRAIYYSTYTGKKWLDPTNYDLCIDTGKMNADQLQHLVFEYIRDRFPELKKKETQQLNHS